MGSSKTLTSDVLKLDCDKELARITAGIRHCVFAKLKKRGVVVALSGGIDSSVVAANPITQQRISPFSLAKNFID